MNLQRKKKLTDLKNEFTVVEDKGQLKSAGRSYMFKMDNQQGPFVQYMELYSILCSSGQDGDLGEAGYMYIYC